MVDYPIIVCLLFFGALIILGGAPHPLHLHAFLDSSLPVVMRIT